MCFALQESCVCVFVCVCVCVCVRERERERERESVSLSFLKRCSILEKQEFFLNCHFIFIYFFFEKGSLTKPRDQWLN